MDQIHDSRKNDFIRVKNLRTNTVESINKQNIMVNPWGVSFYVDKEIEAYKVAYVMRRTGWVKINYSPGNGKWLITSFKDAETMEKYCG